MEIAFVLRYYDLSYIDFITYYLKKIDITI
jgi:hypothetical protein